MLGGGQLLEQIKRHEGFAAHPYDDPGGIETIGYGRNLEDNPLTEKEAEMLLINDLTETIRELETYLDDWYQELDEPRKGALINMAYNMGVMGLLSFTQMLAALRQGDYERAAMEAKDSLWASQVGGRADEIVHQIRTGEWV